ncbi:diphthine synthase [Wallemia mellicola]|uniref:diphthine methyl ester synthase n=3 Tax=Wallemia mellicola TaxID=1708541 RepID=A0AB74KHS9_9BASI|nr:diphthine synthase [Wallemia mellicola]TIC71130.1 diphthine synthase [Wallemia mellicola]
MDEAETLLSIAKYHSNDANLVAKYFGNFENQQPNPVETIQAMSLYDASYANAGQPRESCNDPLQYCEEGVIAYSAMDQDVINFCTDFWNYVSLDEICNTVEADKGWVKAGIIVHELSHQVANTADIMLYVIGLGLSDEKDITVNGLEAVRKSERIYLEAYTSILLVDVPKLEEFYGKSVTVADRDMVETESDAILDRASEIDVSFLVVGDPYGATTHTDLILRARNAGVPVKVIHNASIMNAAGASGLQLYNFGQTVSIPFFTETWKPASFVPRIADNMRTGSHTLLLLDIKVKEQSIENLARGKKIFEPPRYMSVSTAVNQLLTLLEEGAEGYTEEAYTKDTLAISLSRVGSDQQVIKAGTLAELAEVDEEEFGPPLHSMILVGSRLHDLEAEFIEAFSVSTKEKSQ